MKKYFNIETRIATLDELGNVTGKPGRRVFVAEANSFYYWSSENTWVLEAGTDYAYYRCQIFQNGGSGSAYDNVLGEHTLSDFLSWDRLDVGVYRATLEGAFPEYRTDLKYNGLMLNVGNGGVTSPPSVSNVRYVNIERVDDDTILINVLDSALTPIDRLDGLSLEIRVYATNNLRD